MPSLARPAALAAGDGAGAALARLLGGLVGGPLGTAGMLADLAQKAPDVHERIMPVGLALPPSSALAMSAITFFCFSARTAMRACASSERRALARVQLSMSDW